MPPAASRGAVATAPGAFLAPDDVVTNKKAAALPAAAAAAAGTVFFVCVHMLAVCVCVSVCLCVCVCLFGVCVVRMDGWMGGWVDG